jgi:cellulose synthase/poly-beta-1,6-N-acetylglucosamine synthase-like glycosyltransferase
MFSDWMFWISSIRPNEWVLLLLPLFLFDAPRYAVTATAVWLYDFAERAFEWAFGRERVEQFDYAPGITVIIAGLNEGRSIEKGLSRLWGSYPVLQIVVVDDGSSDQMSQVANEFARSHSGVIVITKERGGKSSALNAGLPFAENEIVVILDADSELTETALWEIVQPLKNPRVGAVSGNVLARNKQTNLLTLLQAFEYQRSIFLGRIISSRLGILGIVSGAFGAFRRDLLMEIGGWDVGPGEDEDLVLRLRKMGYLIDFAPYAECYSDVPTKIKVLTKQRRRWEWAVVTFESRKHIDMANPLHANFNLSNFMLFLERWAFNLVLPVWFCLFTTWMLVFEWQPHYPYIFAIYYVVFASMEFLQFLIILDYSNNKRRDISLIAAVPIMPPYQLYQRLVTTWAILEEIIHRRSFKDGFVPKHVRDVTWHW